MDTQKLIDLIARACNYTSALDQPSARELVDWIKSSGMAEEIYRDTVVENSIDALRNSVYSTVSERRAIVIDVLRIIVGIICEEQGLELVYRFADKAYTLHVGIITRQLGDRQVAVYGIRDSGHDAEPTWEYHSVNSRLFLLQGIAKRLRQPRTRSDYGKADVTEVIHIE